MGVKAGCLNYCLVKAESFSFYHDGVAVLREGVNEQLFFC